jgi:protein-S-isoprenylcysteine O-methyltransferase Ste14
MKRKTMPPTYFFTLLILSVVLHFAFPVVKLIYPPYTYSGFVLIAIGAILNIWADSQLKSHKTTVRPDERPTRLITSGAFGISRNPQYLGFTAILLGVVILHGTLSMFIFPVAFVILMEVLFIPMEDKNLERAFSNRYAEYKRKVRRWI